MSDSESVTFSITRDEANRAFRVLAALEWEQYEQVKPLVRAIAAQTALQPGVPAMSMADLRRAWESSYRGISEIGETATVRRGEFE